MIRTDSVRLSLDNLSDKYISQTCVLDLMDFNDAFSVESQNGFAEDMQQNGFAYRRRRRRRS